MKAVIFDLDGTLLNTLDDLTDATNAALRHFGCPERTKEEVRQFVGNGARNLLIKAAPAGADIDAVLAAFHEYYDVHCQDKTGPYPGIPEALAAIRARYPVAVVSNKPDGAVKLLCREFFGDIYALGESAACPRKPAPDMLYQAMKDRHFGKTYIAVVKGVPEKKYGIINAPIAREVEGEMKRVVREDGKESVTEYAVISTDENGNARVRVTLHTGRTHQIRVHMAYIGHPLVNDFLYGTRGDDTYSLHCGSLSFPHPFTGELITLTADEPPKD